jgi:hypothetical protein
VGKLVKVVPKGDSSAEYRYRIKRVYRGGGMLRRGQIVSVRSAAQAAGCALPHGIGATYGLFLLHGHGEWVSGICAVVSPKQMWGAAQHHVRVYRRPAAGSCAG